MASIRYIMCVFTVVTRLILQERMDSGINFIVYTHSQEIEKPNNSKIIMSKYVYKK
jgi:hypothetical protein